MSKVFQPDRGHTSSIEFIFPKCPQEHWIPTEFHLFLKQVCLPDAGYTANDVDVVYRNGMRPISAFTSQLALLTLRFYCICGALFYINLGWPGNLIFCKYKAQRVIIDCPIIGYLSVTMLLILMCFFHFILSKCSE